MNKLTLLVIVFSISLLGCGSDDEITPIIPEGPKYTLSIEVIPVERGIISISPEKEAYNEGEVVTITANVSDSSFEFLNYTGDVTENNNVINITMDTNKSIIANFKGYIYIAENGVTVKAEESANLGQSQLLNGKMYTIVDLTTLKTMITNNEDITIVCTSKINDMEGLFKSNNYFNQNIEGWDVSNVANMREMFRDSNAFNQPIGDWNVSSVTDMYGMFWNSNTFNQPIGNWNVSNVTNMSGVFTSADLFDQPIGDWDVSNVVSMSNMFYNANLFDQPLGDWDVSNVVSMTEMFLGAKSFNQPIANWNVSNVLGMTNMFRATDAFNQPIGNWDVSNVRQMYSMFADATAFNQDLSNWTVTAIIEDWVGCRDFNGGTSILIDEYVPAFVNCN